MALSRELKDGCDGTCRDDIGQEKMAGRGKSKGSALGACLAHVRNSKGASGAPAK